MSNKRQWRYDFDDDSLSPRDHPEDDASITSMFVETEIDGEFFYGLALEKAARPWLDVEDFKRCYRECFDQLEREGVNWGRMERSVLERTLSEVEDPGGYRTARKERYFCNEYLIVRRRIPGLRSVKRGEWIFEAGFVSTIGLSIPVQSLDATVEINREQYYAWPLVVANSDLNAPAFRPVFEHACEMQTPSDFLPVRSSRSFFQAYHARGHRAAHAGGNEFVVFEGDIK